MAKKKSFVLRIDPDVYDAIEKWAAQEFRSANGQIEWIITKALRDARRTVVKTTDENPEEDLSDQSQSSVSE
ncbi:MAG: PTS ascorbate transporter subunit IIC [Prolixibacteraceae bacterium]|nr:PTS ascorbate transporter subunit IIC [Prolixibacteraceae bacterium]MBW8326816.1 PTS ascorbate transporter subunit IIC [Prolixibacteraceae bacterium]